MTASYQSIQLYSTKNANGSFTVTGVHWLTQNAGAVRPAPNAVSQYAGIVGSDLALLRAGFIVEAPFQTGAYPSGTTQASVDTDIATGSGSYTFASMQAALAAQAPPLTTATSRGYNGSTWSAISSATVFDPSRKLVAEAAFVAASGLVPGLAYQRATGYVATSAIALKAVMGTAYTPPGANGQRSLVSTSANDTAAGSGAQQVTITYLDAAFAVHVEVVTLNGLTAVNTVGTNIAYVESMVVTRVGTAGGANLGAISMMSAVAGGGSVVGSIAFANGAGDSQTFWAHHYVAAGVTCYVRWMSAAGTAVLQTAILSVLGTPGAANLPTTQVGPTIVVPAGDQRDHYFDALPVQGPNLIQGYSRPFAATANTSFFNFEWVEF